MKQFNGTDYDILYPKTLVSQVDGNWPLNKVSGVLSIANGGTGATTANGILKNLGLDKSLIYEAGSYIGTGTQGTNHPNVLTFSSQPKYILIYGFGNSDSYISVISDDANAQSSYRRQFDVNTQVAGTGTNTSYHLGVVTRSTNNWSWDGAGWFSGNSYYWYVNTFYDGKEESRPDEQLNGSGITYYYIGIL